MALFTDPPELTVGTPERADNTNPFFGIQSSLQVFPYGGNVYTGNIALKDTTNSFISPYPIVCKRTAANSWSLPDVTNWQAIIDAPQTYVDLWQFPAQCVHNNKIHFVTGTPNPYALLYQTFDLATETYSSIQEPYFVSSGHQSEAVGLTQICGLSDGRLIVAWGSPVSNKAGKFAFISSGGVIDASGTTWKSAAVGETYNLLSMVVDASDTAHIVYRKETGGATTEMYHVSITSGGSVSSPDLMDAASSWVYSLGPGVMFGGNVCFVGSRAFDDNIYLWESDPTSISWIKKTVAARTNDQSGEVYPCPAAVSSTALYIAWQENDNGAPPYPAEVATVQYSIYDGSTFTAKDVAWHAGDNQYPSALISPAGDVSVKAPSLQFSGGVLRLLAFSQYTNFFAGFLESELYLEVVLGPGPPTASGPRNRFY